MHSKPRQQVDTVLKSNGRAATHSSTKETINIKNLTNSKQLQHVKYCCIRKGAIYPLDNIKYVVLFPEALNKHTPSRFNFQFQSPSADWLHFLRNPPTYQPLSYKYLEHYPGLEKLARMLLLALAARDDLPNRIDKDP